MRRLSRVAIYSALSVLLDFLAAKNTLLEDFKLTAIGGINLCTLKSFLNFKCKILVL